MPAGTQRYERTKMVLPLRVWTDEHAEDAAGLQLAHTIDISPIGGRLGGLRTELFPGQTIMLQRGQHKAAFRVIWSKHLANHENQAGIEAVESGRNIWGVDLPHTQIAAYSAADSAAHPTKNEIANAVLADMQAAALPSHLPPVSHMKAPVPRSSRNIVPKVIPRRALWGLSLALFILSGVLTLSLYQEIFNDSLPVALNVPVPGPPSAEELARMTPKPRQITVAVVSAPGVPRVEVAEAPTGRIVYPTAPDDSLGGKVKLQIVIAANGLVKQIHVLSGRQVLAQAAEQAVRFWHYRQFQTDGVPAERETSVVVSFRGTDAVSLEFPSTRKPEIRAN